MVIVRADDTDFILYRQNNSDDINDDGSNNIIRGIVPIIVIISIRNNTTSSRLIPYLWSLYYEIEETFVFPHSINTRNKTGEY